MNNNKHIKILLDNGLNIKTISKLNESQIRVLAEKFNKLETKEQSTTPQNTTPITKPTTSYLVKPNAKTMVNGVEVDTTDGKTVVTPLKETGETNERFKSTAQQRFFWKKCDNSKDKKSKWCQLANDFQKDTKDKNLPKKLHPEKTVKVKTEGYEMFLEDSIVEMVNRYINPAMTKSQLVKTISEKTNKSDSFMLRRPKKNTMFSKEEGREMKTMKRPIGKMFSTGSEMSEDTKEKERTKTREKEKDKDRKNPYAPKHNPAPKAGRGSLPNFLKWNNLGVNLK